jgi:hypothetical protein
MLLPFHYSFYPRYIWMRQLYDSMNAYIEWKVYIEKYVVASASEIHAHTVHWSECYWISLVRLSFLGNIFWDTVPEARLLQTPLRAPRAPIWLPSLVVLNQSQYILHTHTKPPRGCWSSCLFYIIEQTTPNNGRCKCSNQHPTMGDVNATKISSFLVRGHRRAAACWYMRGHSEPRGEWKKGRVKHGKRLDSQLWSVTNRILNFNSSSSKCWYQKEEEGKDWKTEEPAVLWGGGGSLSANTLEFCGIF